MPNLTRDWSQNIRIKLVNLVTFYFAMLVETPMKVRNQPMNLWSLYTFPEVPAKFFTLPFIMSIH